MAKKRKSHKAKTTAKTTTHKRGRKKGSKSKLKSLTMKSMSPKAPPDLGIGLGPLHERERVIARIRARVRQILKSTESQI